MHRAAGIRAQEDKLFNKWSSNVQKGSFIRDGVADPDAYLSSHRRILVLLKEPKSEHGGWDFRDTLKEGPRQQYTWRNLARWCTALRAKRPPDWSEVAEQDIEEQKRILCSVAIVNIKKLPGGTSSVAKDIHAFAHANQTFLRGQLAIYQQDITLLCGTAPFLGHFTNEQELGRRVVTTGGLVLRESSNWGLVVKSCHPQARGRRHRELYEMLAKGIAEYRKSTAFETLRE